MVMEEKRMKGAGSGSRRTKAERVMLWCGAERGRVNKDIGWMLDGENICRASRQGIYPCVVAREKAP
jgi:hypothetical protein